MSPIEIATIRRKLSRMVEDLSHLRACRDLSVEEWRADPVRRAAAERWLQSCIEAAIAANGHLLVSLGHPAPADAYQSFLDVAKSTRIVPLDLAGKLAPSAGLRNHLVHRYDELDDALVLEGLRSALDLFPTYVGAVAAYVDGIERGSG